MVFVWSHLVELRLFVDRQTGKFGVKTAGFSPMHATDKIESCSVVKPNNLILSYLSRHTQEAARARERESTRTRAT